MSQQTAPFTVTEQSWWCRASSVGFGDPSAVSYFLKTHHLIITYFLPVKLNKWHKWLNWWMFWGKEQLIGAASAGRCTQQAVVSWSKVKQWWTTLIRWEISCVWIHLSDCFEWTTAMFKQPISRGLVLLPHCRELLGNSNFIKVFAGLLFVWHVQSAAARSASSTPRWGDVGRGVHASCLLWHFSVARSASLYTNTHTVLYWASVLPRD